MDDELHDALEMSLEAVISQFSQRPEWRPPRFVQRTSPTCGQWGRGMASRYGDMEAQWR